MAAIARHPDLAALARAARAVGGPAIRNMATVGGNLFAPTPYGDFAVALLALGCNGRHRRRRAMPIDDVPGRAATAARRHRHRGRLRASGGRRLPLPESLAGQAEGCFGAEIAAVHRQAPDGTVSLGARSRSAAWPTGRSAPRRRRRPLLGRTLTERRHRAGVGCGRRRHVARHRSDRQRLVSQRSPAGAFPPAAARLSQADPQPEPQTRREDKWRKVPVQFTLNGEEKAEFIDSGTTLLHGAARQDRRHVAQGRLPSGHLRRLLGDHRWRTAALLPDAGRNLRRRRRSTPQRAFRKAASCIRCSAPSSMASPPNAASARPA